MNQYRCTIIRGKSQTEMDNLLPLYAKIIDTICPCNLDDFSSSFNDALKPSLGGSAKKTLDNHRTEIAGKLFGMYYSEEGIVYPSERTLKFLSDGDTPAFFKDICYKMQFPNGSQKWQTLSDRIGNKICIRPFPFILKVLMLAEVLTKKEIGYYILNSLDVLQGKADPHEVYDAIVDARRRGIIRNVGIGSQAVQHINEQINLLEIANLVVVNNGEVALNSREMAIIQSFADKYSARPEFDVYSYNLDNPDIRKIFYFDWDCYFSKLSDEAMQFDTTPEALGVNIVVSDLAENQDERRFVSAIEIGDEGERFVYEYEKRRVAEFNSRLARKVIHLGKTRGLGYDIQSVVAIAGERAEFVKYIEVKATKRVTVPPIDDTNWIDTLNITRNEWIAAQQHRGSYSIFRIYFVRNAVVMFILTDIAQKCDDGIIMVVPTTYRIDFGNNAVDEVIPLGGVVSNA